MTSRVNGEEISQQAIEYELGRLLRFYAEHMPEEQVRRQLDLLKEKARDQAIGAKLLIEETLKLDLKVDPDDVTASLETMVKDAGGREAFDELLARQGITENVIRDGIEQGRRVDMLVERITAGLSDPTEAEMKAHFDEHSEEYTRLARVQAQHILVTFDSENEQERKAALARIEEIRKRTRGGSDFADEAAAHSDCPSGKQTGGSLGWVSRGTMVPELDEVLFSMDVGEISEVVETGLGYHIVRKTGQEDNIAAEFEEVRDKIREFLRHARRGEIIAAHVKELKEKAVIEED